METPFPARTSVYPEALNDTAYNGSEGQINTLGRNSDLSLVTQSRAPTPPRPALSARLMSSWNNAQPAAAALTRKGSVLHSRAKSWLPKTGTSTASTPEKPQNAPNKIFGDLFNGESAPIRLGAPVSPTKEKEESEFVMEYKSTFTERPATMSRRQSSALSVSGTPPAQQKASWFARKTTNPLPSRPQQQQSQDEFTALNINTSLFPNGPADPLNPAAFNDLLLNATSLLQRMQTAYKEKMEYIASIQPEVDAQREEVEEAETRSKHLKIQLEDMGHKAQEQEKAMQEMSAQLTQERIKVREAQESAQTVRLVRTSRDGSDDATPTRRRKRASAGSASDSGFESDLDSVFSANSGAETPASISDYASSMRLPAPGASVRNGNRMGGEGAAWATVEALRGENMDLKRQMAEMQMTLQGCIDFVGGVDGL